MRLTFAVLLSFVVSVAIPRPTSAQLTTVAAKDVVMASLPALIDTNVGPVTHPLTVRLGRYAHVRPILAGPATRREPHDAEWLERQLATPIVRDICEAARLADCRSQGAMIVVAVSEPALEPDGRARIIVALTGSTGDSPDSLEFSAELAVWLRPDSGEWIYDASTVLEMT